jgi:hypothetical protein
MKHPKDLSQSGTDQLRFMIINKQLSESKIERDRFLRELKDLSLQGLSEMYDPESQLFCYRMRKNDDHICREGYSVRYTIITLLGLHRLEAHGERILFDIQNKLRNLVEKAININNIGDIGLILWLCAVVSPEMIDKLWADVDLERSLIRFRDARLGKTTELAWLLAGLSYVAMAPIQNPRGLKDFTFKVYDLLKCNYGNKGIFGHQRKNTIEGKIRGRIGCFADQVYPIYGFSKFAVAYHHGEALRIAKECGNAICQHQGAHGQWWWHYDEYTGNVVGRYPVYSVHQEGMAPMALFALGEASGLDFSHHIYKGLEWIKGHNELGFKMIDREKKMIWRSFYKKKYKIYLEIISSLIWPSLVKRGDKDLKVLHECRPYCFGWLLYAFADKMKMGNG